MESNSVDTDLVDELEGDVDEALSTMGITGRRRGRTVSPAM
jgi:hypothetical protein